MVMIATMKNANGAFTYDDYSVIIYIGYFMNKEVRNITGNICISFKFLY